MADELEHEAQATAEQSERRWATLSIFIVIALAGTAAFAGIHQATMPQARVETVQPSTLHVTGEFVESNLGSAVEPDGSVTVRLVGQQYSFTPYCVLVPAEVNVTFRATSADVVHGFLIEGTNVNTMLIPGYVSVINARFKDPGEHLMPCQEFCSFGHEGMWGRVKVVDSSEFLAAANNQKRLSCVHQ